MATYINELLKLQIIGHLIVDPIRGNRVIWNILQICVPEIQNRIVHRRGDAPDNWVFLSLDLEELIQKPPMMCVQFPKVVEDISDERFQPFAGDDGWVHRTQRLDVHL